MPDDALQFDRAEYEDAQGAATCAQCEKPVAGAYDQVNGAVVCEGCTASLQEHQLLGSRASRAVRATTAGLAAAVAGSLLYYGISALTGYEFGLIAIVVGFGVGTAVRWGSYGRGGWAYQTLAIALTYLAIVSTYVPPIINSLRSADAQTASGTTTKVDGAAATASAAVDAAPPTFGQLLLALTLLLLLACVAPCLAGIQNVIGIVIIGIGLYEAWKLNRRVALDITGPHAVTTAVASV
jgi:hypothetical protein